MVVLYHQIKTPISIWCRRGLNPRSLIQPSKTLPVELTGSHMPIIMSHKNVLTVTNYIPQQGPSFTPQIKLESYSNHKTIIIH